MYYKIEFETITGGTQTVQCELIAAIPDGRRLRLILLGADQKFYEAETDLFRLPCHTVAYDRGDPAGHRPPYLVMKVRKS